MKDLKSRLEKLGNTVSLKHMRGRHDQRTHAWNRGMGGNYSSVVPDSSRRVLALQSRNPAATSPGGSSSNQPVQLTMNFSSNPISGANAQLTKAEKQKVLSTIKNAIKEGRGIRKDLADRELAYESEWSYNMAQRKIGMGEENVMVRRAEATKKHLAESEALEQRRKDLSELIARSIEVLAEDFRKKYPISYSDLLSLKAEIINREQTVQKLLDNAVTEEEKEKYKKQLEEFNKEYEKIKAEGERILKNYNDDYFEFYMEILESLEHDNPFELKVISSDAMDAEFSSGAKRSIPMANRGQRLDIIEKTARMFPNDGLPMPRIGLQKSQRAKAEASESKRLGLIYSQASTSLDDYVHETLHIMQYFYPEVMDVTEDWALSRIGAEKRVRLNTIPQYAARKYRNDETGYVDAVDEPYTLKYYPFTDESLHSFWEVLTMGFTGLESSHQRKDKDLLQIAINAIMNLG